MYLHGIGGVAGHDAGARDLVLGLVVARRYLVVFLTVQKQNEMLLVQIHANLYFDVQQFSALEAHWANQEAF